MNSGTLLEEVIMHPYVNTLQTHNHVQIGTAPLSEVQMRPMPSVAQVPLGQPAGLLALGIPGLVPPTTTTLRFDDEDTTLTPLGTDIKSFFRLG